MNTQEELTMMRYNRKAKIGTEGAVYEFQVKLHRVNADLDDYGWQDEVERAVEDFAEFLRSKYKWIGNVYITGRSGGWLAIEDAKGKARAATLETIDKLVDEGKRHFKKYIEEEYPRSE